MQKFDAETFRDELIDNLNYISDQEVAELQFKAEQLKLCYVTMYTTCSDIFSRFLSRICNVLALRRLVYPSFDLAEKEVISELLHNYTKNCFFRSNYSYATCNPLLVNRNLIFEF